MLRRAVSGVDNPGIPCAVAYRICLVITGLLFLPSIVCSSESPAASDPAAVSIYAASPTANTLFAEASAEFNRDRFDRATAKFQQFLEQYPKDPLAAYAQHYIGACWLEQGEWREAASIFAKVVRSSDAGDIRQESLLSFGWCVYKLADEVEDSEARNKLLDRAGSVFTLFREQYPQSERVDETYFLHAELLYQQQNFPQALPMYRQVVENWPKSNRRPDALFALAMVERELGHAELANEHFGQLLEEYPRDRRTGSIYFEIAERSFANGEFGRAEQLYASVVDAKGHPQADLALVRRAACFAKLDENARAAKLYASLPKKFPDSTYVNESWLAAGHHFVWAGMYEDARRCLTQIVDQKLPGSDKAFHWLVRCYLELGQHDAALAAAKDGLLQEPEGVVRHNLLVDKADALAAIAGQHNESFVAFAEAFAEAQLPVLAVRSLQGMLDSAGTDEQYRYVIRAASKAVDDRSENEIIISAKVAMATAYMNLGEASQTSIVYRELLDQYADHELAADWMTSAAWSHVLAEEYEAALLVVKDYADLFQTESSAVEVLLIRGFSLAKLERFDEAIEPLERVVHLVPDTPNAADAKETLVRCYRRTGKIREAGRTAESLLKQEPDRRDSPALKLDLAGIALSDGNDETAEGYLHGVIDSEVDEDAKASGLHQLAWLNIRQGKTSSAVQHLDRLVKEYSQHALGKQALLDRARCCQLLDLHDEAIADLWRFLDTRPATPKLEATAVFALGISFIHEQRTKDALSAFRTVTENYPNFDRRDEALFQLGVLSHKLGASEDAIAAFERLRCEHPTSKLAASASFHLGQLNYDAENNKAAIEDFRAAIKDGVGEPFMNEAFYRLGWACYREHELGQACAAFATQQSRFPAGDFAHEALFMLAEIQFRRGDWAKASEKYRQVIDHPQTKPEMQVAALLHGGMSNVEIGNYTDAVDWLNRVVREHGESEYRGEAELQLGVCRVREEKWMAAEHHLQIAATVGSREVAAKARYETAKMFRVRGNCGRAVRECLVLMHGFEDVVVSPEVRSLQAQAGQLAAECSISLAANVDSNIERDQLLERAARYWRFIIEKHPESQQAAKARLEIENFVAAGANDVITR